MFDFVLFQTSVNYCTYSLSGDSETVQIEAKIRRKMISNHFIQYIVHMSYGNSRPPKLPHNEMMSPFCQPICTILS